jgi:hypothetical protein
MIELTAPDTRPREAHDVIALPITKRATHIAAAPD